METRIRLKSLRVPGWRVIASVDDRVLVMGAYKSENADLNQKRQLEIRSSEPEVIEAMLWSMCEDLRGSLPPEVGRQVVRLTVKIEEELGL